MTAYHTTAIIIPLYLIGLFNILQHAEKSCTLYTGDRRIVNAHCTRTRQILFVGDNLDRHASHLIAGDNRLKLILCFLDSFSVGAVYNVNECCNISSRDSD